MGKRSPCGHSRFKGDTFCHVCGHVYADAPAEPSKNPPEMRFIGMVMIGKVQGVFAEVFQSAMNEHKITGFLPVFNTREDAHRMGYQDHEIMIVQRPGGK